MKVYVYSNHIWVDISGSTDQQNLFVPLEHINSNLSVNITEYVLLAFKQGHLVQDNSEHSFRYSRACGFHLYKGQVMTLYCTIIGLKYVTVFFLLTKLISICLYGFEEYE